MGRRETEHKGGNSKGKPWPSCCPAPRADALAVGDYKRSRGRERGREPCASARSPARPPSRARALDLPFIDVRRGPCVQWGVYQCANVSSKGEPEPYVHAVVAVGEVLLPCSCDVVAVGGALEPCGSTAVGAVGSLPTSPCFHKGLRAAVVMEHAGCHNYLFTRASQMGRRSCSP
jgi:hypothetical protein